MCVSGVFILTPVPPCIDLCSIALKPCNMASIEHLTFGCTLINLARHKCLHGVEWYVIHIVRWPTYIHFSYVCVRTVDLGIWLASVPLCSLSYTYVCVPSVSHWAVLSLWRLSTSTPFLCGYLLPPDRTLVMQVNINININTYYNAYLKGIISWHTPRMECTHYRREVTTLTYFILTAVASACSK